MTGVPALRSAIAEKNAALYGHRYNPETEITVTAGATQAIMASVLALVHPGDDVVVLEPTYDSYVPSIELAGARPIFVPLDATRGYAPDWERVRAAITAKTRLVMLNFPHNPTGRVLRTEDLAALERIVEDTGVLLLSDEVYEHIVFDGVAHQSLMRSATLAARSVVISSFGKTFHTTGWKVGYACAPAALTTEIRKVHQFMVFAVNTPAQHAFAEYLRDPAPYLGLPAFYQAKRDLFVDGLRDTPFRVLPCEGTYFVLADYSDLSKQAEPEFAQTMITRFGVAVIPVSVFYGTPVDRKVIRFCFAKNDATLREALHRIVAAL
jgi:methionine aminotransferase